MTLMDWIDARTIIAALTGLVLSAIVVSSLLVLKYRRRIERMEAQLDNIIQERTLELQITLQELAEKNQQLEAQSTTDALSGVRNRAYFDQKIVAELNRSRREQRPLAVVLLDIDLFKQVNDDYGHLAGDQIIRQVAGLIQSNLKRCSDHVCRYGGEEFALILPNTDATGAWEVAERIRASLAAEALQVEDHQLSITLSAGCYSATADAASNPEYYIHCADKALYQAKNNGRNQVLSYPPLLSAVQTDPASKEHPHVSS
ncbi:MAG: GGDEF domain-containing protein [Alkalimonas sp.]|nr:GGDEF domain-containing protein [Alkalimonas sp.]